MFEGSTVALVTPFRGGNVDWKAYGDLIEAQIAGGTDALVTCGTTGESPTLSDEEKVELFRFTAERAKGRVPVLAGTGSYDTHHTIELSKAAKAAGCDGLLLVVPYYSKPTQAGLLAHFRAVADAVNLPAMLYNIPGRSAVNMAPETIVRLASHKNIVAVKEASGSCDAVTQISSSCGITVVSGDDSLTLPFMACGASGVVSVVANIVPADVKELVRAALDGDCARALELHRKLFPLIKACFIETSPIPVKTALALMGRCTRELRLPMCEMDPANEEKLKAALAAYGLFGGSGAAARRREAGAKRRKPEAKN
ncbi:MAG: 4-hydroxy-tetrahydrodipicolinate synthase [Planctomycetes bacterium]|nr:4-hydroxy-tetrahydrodipicolinate synthase [Planctomycetota bacterium]